MLRAVRIRLRLFIAFTFAAWLALLAPKAVWIALYEGYRLDFEE